MSLQARCSDCGVTFRVFIQQKLIEGPISLIEIGIECPGCGKWTHSCYTNHSLEQRANHLEELRDQVVSLKNPTQRTLHLKLIEKLTESYMAQFKRFDIRASRLRKKLETVVSQEVIS